MHGLHGHLALVAAQLQGGVNHTLSGTVSGTGSCSAALVVNRRLEGSIAGAGSLSATLVVNSPLAGSFAGTGALSGSLIVEHVMAGSVAGLGALSGALACQRPLAGSLDGTGALSASLIVNRTLSGAFSGAGGLSGTLAVSGVLAGSLSGSAALAGALVVNRHLAGTFGGAGLFRHIPRVVLEDYEGALAQAAGQRYEGVIDAAYIGQLLEDSYEGGITPEGDDMFSMIVGDLSPSFRATLENSEGDDDEFIDLTTAESVDVQFKMGASGSVTTAAATIVSAADKTVRYDWSDGDTDTAGTMYLRFVVNMPAGPQTFPSNGDWFEIAINR